MSSEMTKQSLVTEEGSRQKTQRANLLAKTKRISFGNPDALSATSITKAVGEVDAGHQRDFSESVRIPDNLEVLDSHGARNMEEVTNLLTDQPPSDALVEAFKGIYERERRSRSAGLRSIAATSTVTKASSQQDTLNVSDEDDEDGFQNFLSVVTDSKKFSMCLRGEPDSESDIECFRILNCILNAEDLPSSTQKEIMGYYRRKSLGQLLGSMPNEDKYSHVLKYYAKGAHLMGLQSKQLLKYMLPEGYEDRNSPYSERPSLNANYRPYKRTFSSPKIQPVKSTKSHKPVELEHHIGQLCSEREGVKTRENVTPVKIKVPLKVKNREKLTYDDINQIRRKAKEGVNLYLRTQTRCKRSDTLRLWGSLQNSYSTLSNCSTFPETFSTYSWSWSGRRNMVEIWELVDGKDTASPLPSPAPSTLPKSTSCQA